MNTNAHKHRFTDLHTLRITHTPSCTRTIRCSPYHISSDLYRIHWHHINRLHKQTALHAPEEKKQHCHILQPSYTQIHDKRGSKADPIWSEIRGELLQKHSFKDREEETALLLSAKTVWHCTSEEGKQSAGEGEANPVNSAALNTFSRVRTHEGSTL